MAKKMIRWHLFSKVYLIMYMLFSEYMVAEQSRIYSRAQGLSGPRYWIWVNFVYRVVTKGTLRAYENIFGKVAQKAALALQMGDERVIAHMD